MDVSRNFTRSPNIELSSTPIFDLTYYHAFSFTGPSKSIEHTQRVLLKNHLPIAEQEGDLRKYRASYSVYLRSPPDTAGSQVQLRDLSYFIGRVGVKECAEYGLPFPDNLTISKDIMEKKKILKMEVGYAFLSKAWGNGYAPEAMKALVEAYSRPCGFWNPMFEQIYLHGVTGGANLRSRKVLEKIGFKLNGIHRWDGPEVFIGGAMQPPEVCVFSLSLEDLATPQSKRGDEVE
jgi:RimJ/RimL family protein N-acetyltransferase